MILIQSLEGTDEEIAKGFQAVVQKFMDIFDTNMIVILQIPRKTSDDRAKNINELMETYFEENPNDKIQVLNPYKNFTKSNGKQDFKYYVSDGFHLNQRGYQLLAELLQPFVDKALSEEK